MTSIWNILKLLEDGRNFVAGSCDIDGAEHCEKTDAAIKQIREHMSAFPDQCTVENCRSVAENLLAYAESPFRLLVGGPTQLLQELLHEMTFLGLIPNIEEERERVLGILREHMHTLYYKAQELCRSANGPKQEWVNLMRQAHEGKITRCGAVPGEPCRHTPSVCWSCITYVYLENTHVF